MSEITKIEWADKTFNPWIGCTKVSPGCMKCYAEARDIRFAKGAHWGKGAPRQRTSAATWKNPVKWNKEAAIVKQRPRVFPSLCDWLDAEVPIEWLVDFLRLIHDTPNLDWLLLTKRPENWKPRLQEAREFAFSAFSKGDHELHAWLFNWLNGEPHAPKNIWLGVSVENQECADERIPLLLATPAKIRFLSVEPLLGSVNLTKLCADESMGSTFNCLTGYGDWNDAKQFEPIDWVIIGGESGHEARPCNVNWIQSIIRQCWKEKVPCFVKQLGANSIQSISENSEIKIELKHPKGGDTSEWPEDLKVRQYPTLLALGASFNV